MSVVKMRNFVHKGLKRLYAEDIGKGVPPDTVDTFRKMLAFIDDMQDPEELRVLPAWKVHTLLVTVREHGASASPVTAG
jgi:toxin HigB-1